MYNASVLIRQYTKSVVVWCHFWHDHISLWFDDALNCWVASCMQSLPRYVIQTHMCQELEQR